MKKQLLILLSISLMLLLGAGCARTAEKFEETNKNSSSNIPVLDTKIDSLKNKIQENTEQNISIERRLSAVEEKLCKVKDLEPEVSQIHTQIDRNLTHGINITILIIATLTFIITLMAVVLGQYIINRVKEFRTDINDSLAMVRNNNAISLFYKKKFEEAIKEGEKALKHVITAHGEKPIDLEKKTFLSIVKSNLSYYWVAANKIDNKEIALQYAKEGLKTGKIAYVDNFLYIFMKLAKTREEKLHWKEIYLAYKNEVVDYHKKLHLKNSSLQRDYENFFREINIV